jgi:hypothetical protein
MPSEQKEGVLLTVLVMFFMIVLAFLANWSNGFSEAEIYVELFEKNYPKRGLASLLNIKTGSDYFYIDFGFKFSTALIFLLPVFFYGLLRSFGIVKRMFGWERTLSKFIASN